MARSRREVKIKMRKTEPEINLEDILTDRFQEDDLLEVPLHEGVFRFFSASVIVIAGFAAFQILNVGVVKYDFYKARASANMSFMEVSRAPRGVIFDRFGKPLTELTEKIKAKNWDFSEKLELSGNLNYEQIAVIQSAKIPGLSAESVFKRDSQPTGVFSHLVGFTGLVDVNDLETNPALFIDDEIGRAGLEAYYDDYLRGENGREAVLRNAEGEVKGKTGISLAKPGRNLATFVDKEFQEYFYNRISDALQNLGREIGVGVALNPQNGEVLALFNIPSFGVNDVSDVLTGSNKPLFNRAVSGLYNPGSTIKPLVAIAALAEGIIDKEKQIYSAGFIEIPNPYVPGSPSRFLDWRAHGWVDLRAALARSSNVYFYEVGGGLPAQAGFEGQIGLGIERLRTWWHKFNLDEKTLIDLPGEKAGFLPSPAWKEEKFGEPWRIGDTYNVAIGQGDLLVTPLELLNYIASVANGGKFYAPRVVKNVFDGAGEEILKSEPKVLKDLGPEVGSILKEIQDGMIDAVEEPYGTAYLLSDLPFKAAAKTGTAQIQNNEKVNAFFVGYAPAENPEIAILVLVENAREGSLNAVPVAKDVLLWYYENRIKTRQ
ncbi:MAG: Penicillin-binding protein 2 [Candidatus Jorgensenbacteria bacterium GW2011_GWC1_48_8]|uniref:Penicillin-binding protein 2 n=1 Tax=Candidatus Jorgensenbacteria bacterium GW2011_GWC1_48_8 TaxID=1618666 RepID=A0A0G1X8M9_9BACT|nr:MAG: Penicillin-binding protein 2 [Candidatus Jorgensenbacteria bacterium GW2011_GWC1_48_8]